MGGVAAAIPADEYTATRMVRTGMKLMFERSRQAEVLKGCKCVDAELTEKP